MAQFYPELLLMGLVSRQWKTQCAGTAASVKAHITGPPPGVASEHPDTDSASRLVTGEELGVWEGGDWQQLCSPDLILVALPRNTLLVSIAGIGLRRPIRGQKAYMEVSKKVSSLLLIFLLVATLCPQQQ